MEQCAEQRVLQPQEDGQKSLKHGQLKAAERQEGDRRKSKKEDQRCDRAEGRQEVVGKGEEEVQTRGVKNPPGEI